VSEKSIALTRGTQRFAQSMVLAEWRLATFSDRLRRSATTPAQASLLATKHLVLPQSALFHSQASSNLLQQNPTAYKLACVQSRTFPKVPTNFNR
jgi:hypothetical protein